jgi:uncharacterized protein (DUF983 family)
MAQAPPGGAPTAPTLVEASLKGLCPRCGSPTLFAGIARFAPVCRACGLDIAAFNVGDGPAVFLILIVGTIVTVGALALDAAVGPPWWVHLVWLPVGIGLTLAGLRLGKAALAFQEYRHRAAEGKIAK